MIRAVVAQLPDNGNLADQGAGLGFLLVVAFLLWVAFGK